MIFSKIFEKKEQQQTTNFIDKQLVFNQIHIEQNRYIALETPQKEKPSRRRTTSSSDNSGWILFGILIATLFLIYGYLKFEVEISRILIATTVLLESLFVTASFVIVRKFYVDIKLKTILLFNIIATVCLPILVYQMKNPIRGNHINKVAILEMMEQEGFISLLLSGDSSTYGYLLYQSAGIFVILLFIVFVILGAVHVLSMVNLTLNNRFQKMWKWLYKKTIHFCKSCGGYVFFGSLLLVVSFLFISGILISLLTSIGK